MSDLFWLTDEQLRPFFPRSHGRPRVDDRRVLSGIVFVNRNGLRCVMRLAKHPARPNTSPERSEAHPPT